MAGSFAAVDLGDAALDAIVIAGLIAVLALLLSSPGRWLEGRGGEIWPFGPVQILAYLAIGVYAGLVVLGSGFFMLAAQPCSRATT